MRTVASGLLTLEIRHLKSTSYSDFKILKQCAISRNKNKPKRNHCHTLHEENVGLGASSKNQINKHKFKKKKIEYNRIRVTRFQPVS